MRTFPYCYYVVVCQTVPTCSNVGLGNGTIEPKYGRSANVGYITSLGLFFCSFDIDYRYMPEALDVSGQKVYLTIFK